MINAVSHVRPMGQGSLSQLLRAEDGNHYVVKFLGNPQGNKILANEYVVGKLSELLDAPCPTVTAIVADNFIVSAVNASQHTNFQPGVHIGIRYLASDEVEIVPSTMELMRLATNVSEWPMVILLDSIFQNVDRKIPHVLIARNRQSQELVFWAIDHGHCLGVTNPWSTLNTQQVAVRSMADYSPLVNGEYPFSRALNRLLDLDAEDVGTVIQSCPSWNVNETEKEALVSYVMEAVNGISDKLIAARHLFPGWTG